MDIDSITGIISTIIAFLVYLKRKPLGSFLCALVFIVFCGKLFVVIDNSWISILLFFAIVSLVILLVFLFKIMTSEYKRTEFIKKIKHEPSETLFLVTLLTPLLIYLSGLIFNNYLPQEIDFASYISYIATQKISVPVFSYIIQNWQITIFYILRCLTLIVSVLSIAYSFLKLNNSGNLNFSDSKNLLFIAICIVTFILISTNAVYQFLYENLFPLF